MLTITIFAAGLVCLAGVLGLRLGRAQAQVSTVAAQASADERGITLQTLIVTAVLVLMAVAAGVVIVAITNNAAEDLEQQATSIESQCGVWEIYDPVLASRNAKGRAGSDSQHHLGTAPGCIPACIWQDSDSGGDEESSELSFDRNFMTALAGAGTVAMDDVRVLIMEDGDIKGVGASSAKATIDFDNITGEEEIRVGPDQRSCVLYSAKGDRLHTSS